MSKHASFVDSTVRLKLELTKEKFDSCEFGESIESDYTVQIGNQTSEWKICIYPKGDREKNFNNVSIYIELSEGDDVYDVLFGFGVETDSGHWPHGDLVEKLYSNRKVINNNDSKPKELYYTFDVTEKNNWGYHAFCKTEEFRNQFVENKVTFVATLVFHMEGKRFLQQKEVAETYVENIRSMPLQENLSDVTIICSGKQFPSYKVLLAASSKYFEALFRHEHQKKEIDIEDASPEIVEALLEFMSKGLIPKDIDAKAGDLIEVADKYRIELLSKVCLTSMVDNLTRDNALETLITVDKLKHITKSEHRVKILSFIKKEAKKIVNGENWERFILSYPSLVSEIVLSLSACCS